MKTIGSFFLIPLLFLFMVSCEENINEPVVENQVFSLDENAPRGTVVGLVDAYDLDIGQILSFSIAGGNDEGTFSIDSASGLVVVEDPAQLDYEMHTQLSFTVKVADDGDPVLESTANVTVSLKDINEFAPVMEDQAFDVEEGAAAGTLVGTLDASDPETQQALMFFILNGNEAGVFSLGDQTGELSVLNSEAIDYQLNPQFLLTVMVRDVHVNSLTDTAAVTIQVIPK
jgi:hypothetical protein